MESNANKFKLRSEASERLSAHALDLGSLAKNFKQHHKATTVLT